MELSPELKEKARKVKLIVLDVDGVLSDGKITINDDGEESKNFYVRDGLAITHAIRKGYFFSIISGRYSRVVENRCAELGIKDVHQNVDDKLKVFESVLKKENLSAEEAAYMGDDVNDITLLEAAGFSAAPADADDTVKGRVAWLSSRIGGYGAVREMIEIIMKEQRTWEY